MTFEIFKMVILGIWSATVMSLFGYLTFAMGMEGCEVKENGTGKGDGDGDGNGSRTYDDVPTFPNDK